MYLIPSLNTQEEVLEVLNKIESCEEPGTAGNKIANIKLNYLIILLKCLIFIIAWVNDKRTPWVLSGVSYAFTKMDSNIWHQTPNNTNVGESAHANVNHDGRNLSLLAGIAR